MNGFVFTRFMLWTSVAKSVAPTVGRRWMSSLPDVRKIMLTNGVQSEVEKLLLGREKIDLNLIPTILSKLMQQPDAAQGILRASMPAILEALAVYLKSPSGDQAGQLAFHTPNSRSDGHAMTVVQIVPMIKARQAVMDPLLLHYVVTRFAGGGGYISDDLFRKVVVAPERAIDGGLDALANHSNEISDKTQHLVAESKGPEGYAALGQSVVRFTGHATAEVAGDAISINLAETSLWHALRGHAIWTAISLKEAPGVMFFVTHHFGRHVTGFGVNALDIANYLVAPFVFNVAARNAVLAYEAHDSIVAKFGPKKAQELATNPGVLKELISLTNWKLRLTECILGMTEGASDWLKKIGMLHPSPGALVDPDAIDSCRSGDEIAALAERGAEALKGVGSPSSEIMGLSEFNNNLLAEAREREARELEAREKKRKEDEAREKEREKKRKEDERREQERRQRDRHKP